MKFLNEMIPEEFLLALGWTLVHSLWQLILIAAVLWIGLRLMKKSKASIKYGLSVAALALSFVAVAFTFIYQLATLEQSPVISSDKMELLLGSSDYAQADFSLESSVEVAIHWIEQSLPLLVNVWFLGALLFLFRLLNSLSEIRLLRKSSQNSGDFELEKTMYRLMGKLNISRDVQLKISDTALSPLTFGTLKPIILLPAGLIFQLSPSQLEAILAHELAHVKRNDFLSNLLLSFLEIFLFFHPCYWWMSSTVKELRENAADDLAVKVGIEPKTLATGLAEVLNFARQSPPELALAAGKKRNPTLQRIKRILGHPSQNYPQNPIISIPMMLTLFLSAGLMASAQQDAPKPEIQAVQKNKVVAIQPTYAYATELDTLPSPKVKNLSIDDRVMTFVSDDGVKYRIQGDLLVVGNDTVPMTPKIKAELDKIFQFNSESIPPFDIPEMPDFPLELEIEHPLDLDFELSMSEMPLMPEMDFDMMVPPMEPFDMEFDFKMDESFPGFYFKMDTTKMTQAEKEKLRKEMELKAEKWGKEAEARAKEWEAKWKATEGDRQAKIAEWEAKFKSEFEPKMKEFEAKMKEWQAANEPKMKEFESKMKAWQEAQEPKMKEWEAKMKEWEVAQKPKMEEFQRKMEVWQKEHQQKMEEFQKLLQEELKKNNK